MILFSSALFKCSMCFVFSCHVYKIKRLRWILQSRGNISPNQGHFGPGIARLHDTIDPGYSGVIPGTCMDHVDCRGARYHSPTCSTLFALVIIYYVQPSHSLKTNRDVKQSEVWFDSRCTSICVCVWGVCVGGGGRGGWQDFFRGQTPQKVISC